MSAIKAVDEIRKHKTKNGLSLGAEIDSIKLKTKVKLEKIWRIFEKSRACSLPFVKGELERDF